VLSSGQDVNGWKLRKIVRDLPQTQKENSNKLSGLEKPFRYSTDETAINLDEDIALTADLLLRSAGSWPEVLIERCHRILWKSDTLE